MRVIMLFFPLLLVGCLAKAVIDVATLPVSAGAGVVKAVVPSQAKADRKRGKEMRKAEAREEKARRQNAEPAE